MSSEKSAPSDIWVNVDGRRFIVKHGTDGTPKRVLERKVKYPGHPFLSITCNAMFWDAKHHTAKRDGSLIKRVLQAAADAA